MIKSRLVRKENEVRYNKNQSYLGTIKDRNNKTQGCQEKIEESYNKNQGCLEKLKIVIKKLRLFRKN